MSHEFWQLSSWRLNPWALLPLTNAVCSILMASLLWRNRGTTRRRGLAFAGVAVTTGFWAFGIALAMSFSGPAPFARLLAQVILAFLVTTGPFTLIFAFDFIRVPRRDLILAASIALTIISIVLIFVDPEVVHHMRQPSWGGWYPVSGRRMMPTIAPVLGAVLLCVFLSYREWRRLPPSRRRRQIGYILVAFIIGILGGVDIYGAEGHDVLPIGWATSLGANFTVYYAIVRWRLLDIRTAIHRTILVVVGSAATFAPLYLLARWSEGWAGWSSALSRTVAIAGTLVLLRLYGARVQSAVAGMVGRRRRQRSEIVERLANRILQTRTKEQLVGPLGDALREAAGLELEALALAVDVGEGPPMIYTVLPAEKPPAPFPSGGTLPREARTRAELDPEASAAAFLDELGPGEAQLQAADRVVNKWLDAYQADVLVPLRLPEQEIGAMVCRAPGRVFTLDEVTRDLLGRVAARASVALTNACMVEDLERRSLRLEAEVEERTHTLARAIDDLKVAQVSLVQAEKQSSLGLLVAGVSHEINNALNFIYGNLPTLGKYAKTYDELAERCRAAGATPPPEVAERRQAPAKTLGSAIDAVTDAARRARTIVDDLRRFARHDEAERKQADVREGLTSTLNLLRAELSGRIQVQRRWPDGPIVPPIECYPAALNHVFLNVLLNAAQSIVDSGTVTIDVQVADHQLEVRIADDGAGLSPEARSRAFEPFFTTRKRAAGLGLTVSRQIVLRHGGTISLEPNEPRGVVVRIALPMLT